MVIIYFQMYHVPFQVLKSFHKYVSPIYYVSFLITAFAVYFYIFKLIYNNQKAHKRSMENIARIHQSEHHSFSNIKYLIPFWTIITFILSQILPDALLTINVLYQKQYDQKIRTTVVTLLRLGFVVDPIIYIFNLKIVKRGIQKIKTSVSTAFSTPSE